MRTLLLGASGQLGSAVRAAWPHEMSALDCPPHSMIDITDAERLDQYVFAMKQDLIVNCAAWTDMNGAERDYERAHAVNACGPRYLAEAAGRIGARMIQISTDYCDLPANEVRGAYAVAKLGGERAVVKILGDRATILRLSCLLSTHPNGWLSYVIRSAVRGEPIRVAAQVTYPTTVETVAKAIIHEAAGSYPVPRGGVFCVAGTPAISKHALADMAIRLSEPRTMGDDTDGPSVEEVPPDSPGSAPRRVDSRLRGPWLGERADWRPWLQANAPIIADRERDSSSARRIVKGTMGVEA